MVQVLLYSLITISFSLKTGSRRGWKVAIFLVQYWSSRIDTALGYSDLVGEVLGKWLEWRSGVVGGSCRLEL
jgi:hypothetical protein